MKMENESIGINNTVCSDSVSILVEEDILLPDSKSDIAKILQIDSEAEITNALPEDEKLTVSGRISFNMTYVPDGEDRIACSYSQPVDFSESISNSAITADSKPDVRCKVWRVEFTTLNSRKVALRVILEVSYKIYRKIFLPTAPECEGAEIKYLSETALSAVHISKTRFSVKDELLFGSAKPSAQSVLKSSASVSDKSAVYSDGRLQISGNIDLCTLYVSSDNTIEFITFQVPFCEYADADGITDESIYNVNIGVCETDLYLKPDSDGDMRMLDAAFTLCASVFAYDNVSFSYAADCFGKRCDLQANGRSFDFSVYKGESRRQCTVKCTVPASDISPEISKVYDVIARPEISASVSNDGKISLSGEVGFYLLYLSKSRPAPVCSAKSRANIDISFDMQNCGAGTVCDISAEAAKTSYTINAAGDVEIRCIVEINIFAYEMRSVDVIESIEESDSPLPVRHGITIYYVRDTDTAWGIAKKYRVSEELLKAVNKIEGDAGFKAGMRLLIPSSGR